MVVVVVEVEGADATRGERRLWWGDLEIDIAVSRRAVLCRQPKECHGGHDGDDVVSKRRQQTRRDMEVDVEEVVLADVVAFEINKLPIPRSNQPMKRHSPNRSGRSAFPLLARVISTSPVH